jgi:hypothetical protein
MSLKSLYQWEGEVARRFGGMSKPHLKVLAMISYAMVLAKSCGLTTISVFLASLLGKSENTMRQQVREFYYDAEDKKGKTRKEVEVENYFEPLMKWVMSLWQTNDVALAIDATSLGQNFVVLVVSTVCLGCAIPVAWKVIPGQEKGSWKGHWQKLLKSIAKAVPKEKQVIVLADRGLYAKWMYQQIVDLGWHPFLRINHQGNYRVEGNYHFSPLSSLFNKKGNSWSGKVTVFSTPKKQLNCSLIACWEDGYTDPWLIVTDLTPSFAKVSWYSLRCWIERSFKFIKRSGWQWHQTKMRDPKRAERMWLVLAVSTLWVVSVGNQSELEISNDFPLPDLSSLFSSYRTVSRSTSQPRLLSVFRRGILTILVALLNHKSLPIGSFLLPEPWPSTLSSSLLKTTFQSSFLEAA